MSARRPLVLLVSLLMVSTMTTTMTDAAIKLDGEKKLFRSLLDDYEPAVRPRRDPSESVEIDIDFELNQIKNWSNCNWCMCPNPVQTVDLPYDMIDEKREILQTIGFVEASWQDDYLKWNPSNHSDITEIVIPPGRIWLPDFGIENSAESFYDDTYFNNFRVLVLYTGETRWSFGGIFQTSCDIDTTFYPFDLQKCTIRMENWAYSKRAVDLRNGSSTLHMDGYHPHGIWTIWKTRAYTEEVFFDTDPDAAFARVLFEINLLRKPHYYVVNIMVPCLFLTSIAILVFVLPPESGEKVSLGVTILLSFSVFQFVIAENTPVNSDCTPLLGIFVAVTMGMSTLSVVTTVLVLHLHHHCSATPVPRWIQVIFFQYIARLVCLNELSSSDDKPAADDDNGVALKRIDGPTEMEHDNLSAHQSQVGVGGAADGGNSDRVEVELRRTRAHLDGVTSYINLMTSRMTEQDAAESLNEDWRSLAKIVDRLLLLVTIAGLILSALCVLIYSWSVAPSSE